MASGMPSSTMASKACEVKCAWAKRTSLGMLSLTSSGDKSFLCRASTAAGFSATSAAPWLPPWEKAETGGKGAERGAPPILASMMRSATKWPVGLNALMAKPLCCASSVHWAFVRSFPPTASMNMSRRSPGASSRPSSPASGKMASQMCTSPSAPNAAWHAFKMRTTAASSQSWRMCFMNTTSHSGIVSAWNMSPQTNSTPCCAAGAASMTDAKSMEKNLTPGNFSANAIAVVPRLPPTSQTVLPSKEPHSPPSRTAGNSHAERQVMNSAQDLADSGCSL
mmetsp:Transcript_129636/g.362930  ORF Transcript_129636/g.362930 Transcript_129636/m.362930 type:complete len:280 (-) Transcript_129636:615-1454(-)